MENGQIGHFGVSESILDSHTLEGDEKHQVLTDSLQYSKVFLD